MVLVNKPLPEAPPAVPELHLVFFGAEGVGISSIIGHLVYELADKNRILAEEKAHSDLVASYDGSPRWVAAKLRNPISFSRVPALFRLKNLKDIHIHVEGCAGQKGFFDNLVSRDYKDTDVHVGVIVVAPGVKFPTFAIDDAAKHQIALAKTVGLKNIVIAVNRMDLAHYSRGTFNQMIYELEKYLREIGYSPDDVQIIPVSAAEGENITENKGNMSWYMGTKILHQPTLLEAILQADKGEGADSLPEPKQSSSFEVLAVAHDDVDVGYSGKFRVKPEKFQMYLENSVDGVVEDICYKISNDRGVPFDDDEPKILRKGQMGVLKISTSEPVEITTSDVCPPLSRFHCMTKHVIRISGIAIPDVERKGQIWTPTHYLPRTVFFGVKQE